MKSKGPSWTRSTLQKSWASVRWCNACNGFVSTLLVSLASSRLRVFMAILRVVEVLGGDAMGGKTKKKVGKWMAQQLASF
jgi:hypothetical protein